MPDTMFEYILKQTGFDRNMALHLYADLCTEQAKAKGGQMNKPMITASNSCGCSVIEENGIPRISYCPMHEGRNEGGEPLLLRDERLWKRMVALSHDSQSRLLCWIWGWTAAGAVGEDFLNGAERYLDRNHPISYSCEACGLITKERCICPSCGFDDAIPVSDVPRELEDA